MKKGRLFFCLPFLLFISGIFAQSVSFQDDIIRRGYYERPYARYEAEQGKCVTNGTILTPTYDQRQIQSEASNQSAVQLNLKDTYVQWINGSPADGLTIRFSLPDNEKGTGTQGTIALYVNDSFIQNITLDSYWAWQYILKNGSKYPDNTPDASTKFPRMRFDEMHVKLANKIPAGSTFKLVKADDNTTPYTIDFVELEEVPVEVTFASITDANKVEYSSDKGNLAVFIAQNSGKTIYIPAGRHEVDRRIMINGDNTKIIGAGMWYSEIYFTASSDDRSTYSQRGIESYASNIVLEGFYLNTVNNKRYYNNDDRYQVGKGLMGSFGSNSRVRDLWIQHFECGAWIEGADGLAIEHCRFRDNYADGINFAYGCKNSYMEHSSFRNNGDDDMASWSRSDRMCENNSFRYCTSENNWRASSLGFFGGKQNKAYNCVIIDPMEAGFRITCDFPGMPFSNEGYSEFYNISVYKGGVASGTVGTSGDLWGNQQGALHINASSQYDLQNIKIYNIDLYDSKNDAVFIGCNSKYIRSLVLNNINIRKTGRYGLYFYDARGDATYCNINYENIGATSDTNALPSAFSFIENCSSSSAGVVSSDQFRVFSVNGELHINSLVDSTYSIFNSLGQNVYNTISPAKEFTVKGLYAGLYIVKWNKANKMQKVLVY